MLSTNLAYLPASVPGFPKKYQRLISNRTKVSFFLFLNKRYSNLDFATKIVEIR